MPRILRARGRILFITAFLSGLIGRVMAAAETGEYLKYQQPESATSSWVSTGGYVLSLIFTFLIVIGLAYFTSRLLAQRMANSGGIGGGRVHSSLLLGPNRGIYVVEIAGKYMVLGVTEHNITLLREITSSDEIESVVKSQSKNLPTEGFDSILHQQLGMLKQMHSKFPAVFGIKHDEMSEKEYEKDNRKR